jgi:sec-independent protein translocase protein TatA
MSQVFLFIGGSEIVVILLIVVMLFGADKIPEIARGLGKGLQEVKNASNEIKREINSQSGGVVGMAKDIKDNVDAGKRNLTDIKGSVSREMYKTFADNEETKTPPATETKAPETESPKKED